ncbi:hypothetical protein HanIR_Chr17g0855911 [Helianthus annuus]|nr:hypothetical protein HanIR_Chr17g0855911 [Helianthus annuus]
MCSGLHQSSKLVNVTIWKSAMKTIKIKMAKREETHPSSMMKIV